MVLNLYSGLFNSYCYMYLQVKRGITKIHNQELWFLHSAHRRTEINICMKFYEDERL